MNSACSEISVRFTTAYRQDKENSAAGISLADRVTRDLLLHSIEYAEEFTRVYKLNQHKGKAVREAACLGVMLREALQPLHEVDLLAGRFIAPAAGVSPEPGGIGFYFNFNSFTNLLEHFSEESEVVARIEELIRFWQGRTTREHIRAAFDEFTVEVLPSDDYNNVGGVPSFPLYRIGGCQLDYKKLLRLGIPGLRESVSVMPAGDFREGLLAVCDLFCDLSREYATHARSCGKDELAAVLESITTRSPQSLYEALQLSWLYSAVSGVINYGRIDEYLGSFLAHDLESGALSIEKAHALLRCQWRIIAWRNTIWNGRIMLGGRGRENEADADRFALLAMEVHRELRLSEPQLSLRFYQGQNPALYQKALDLIGEGLTYPILYNDDINIPAVSKAMGVSTNLAQHYLPFGCGEYILNHRSIGTPNGLINLACLLINQLKDGRAYTSFEALYEDFTERCGRELNALARAQACSYDVTASEVSLLWISLLYDDCLARNRPLLEGGVVHRGGTMESYGNTNTADSLSAIKHLVFDCGELSLEEICSAIRNNFASQEDINRKLKEAPKYGNDEVGPDQMAKRVHDTICAATIAAGKAAGFDSYLVVMINNSANSTLGNLTGATPDGRRALRPLANANNPQPGADLNGVSAMLNSLNVITKDNHAGVVQNLRLQKAWFTENRPVLEALLAGYFNSGGTQVMITVTSRAELEAALRDPESHTGLLVRVGGFSARFIDLPSNVQEEILSRTDY